MIKRTRPRVHLHVKRSDASRSAAPGSHAKSLTLAAMSLGFGVVQLDVTIVKHGAQ